MIIIIIINTNNRKEVMDTYVVLLSKYLLLSFPGQSALSTAEQNNPWVAWCH